MSFATVALDHEGPITQIPELCIEILSNRRAYDRITKRLVYGEAGVRELWTVSPDGEVERWHGDRLSACEVHQTQLTSPLLPGFAIDLDLLRV